MTDVAQSFKALPKALQLVYGGAAAFIIGALLDSWSMGDTNLLDDTPGIVTLAALVGGALALYSKQSKVLGLVLIVAATGAMVFMFMLGIFEDFMGGPGAGLWLLTGGGLCASWGAIMHLDSE